eukprot:9710880-Karenia_brevis.AAC.1
MVDFFDCVHHYAYNPFLWQEIGDVNAMLTMTLVLDAFLTASLGPDVLAVQCYEFLYLHSSLHVKDYLHSSLQ